MDYSRGLLWKNDLKLSGYSSWRQTERERLREKDRQRERGGLREKEELRVRETEIESD